MWNGTDTLDTAILVDVDGTLVGPYRNGVRELRQSAPAVLEMLASHAPVFLWSIVGADNPERVLKEFPVLKPFISGCYAKQEFPIQNVANAYCIDDTDLDKEIFQCHYYLLPDCYNGGDDTPSLVHAATDLIQAIEESRSQVLDRSET